MFHCVVCYDLITLLVEVLDCFPFLPIKKNAAMKKVLGITLYQMFIFLCIVELYHKACIWCVMWMLLAHTTKLGCSCHLICLGQIQFMPVVTLSLLLVALSLSRLPQFGLN